MVKNPPASAGDARDMGSMPGLGRSHGGGNGNPLQYSCLENPMDRGVWWATVLEVAKSQTQLSDETTTTRVKYPVPCSVSPQLEWMDVLKGKNYVLVTVGSLAPGPGSSIPKCVMYWELIHLGEVCVPHKEEVRAIFTPKDRI